MTDDKGFQQTVVMLVRACACWVLSITPVRAQQDVMPQLRRQGTASQLVVDGKPFLVLAGELGNSTSSSLAYMQPVWPKLVSLNLNTVLVPVYWELIEPAEGKFDFALVDGLIQEARRHQLRIVPLWFASWKNSMSCYAPAWVKTNQQRGLTIRRLRNRMRDGSITRGNGHAGPSGLGSHGSSVADATLAGSPGLKRPG